MDARCRWLSLGLAFVMATSLAVLWLDPGVSGPRHREATASFQRLVGGLGFGASLGLDGCEPGYDPGLEGGRSMDLWPIPGGAAFIGSRAALPPYPGERSKTEKGRGSGAAPP
jgi:hypothetical protein